MKPWLLLPVKMAHDLSPWAISFFSLLFSKPTQEWRRLQWKNLSFSNRLGIAGGVDKTGRSLLPWQKLGAGFLEVGTITPLAQTANPGSILERNKIHQALWNKMGFPNAGAESLAHFLQQHRKEIHVPLFINIGKNRSTPNDQAHQDYIACMEKLAPYADAFVVNISSPNTKDLRALLSPEQLQNFLSPLLSFNKKQKKSIPLLLKLSPDSDENTFLNALKTSRDLGIDGWILTNTTTHRLAEIPFPTEGGMSGKPLANLSKKNLQLAVQFLGNNKKEHLLISVGGVSCPTDVQERISMGADLVQVYSALVFEGPFIFQNWLRSLIANDSAKR